MYAFILIVAFLVCSCQGASKEEANLARQEIVQRLQQWPLDFNARRIEPVCQLFAPDLVASYPDSKDRNYAEMCRGLTRVLADQETSYHYEAPEIEQIIIEGNMAVVRLIWPLTITHMDGRAPEMVREKGIDLFRRQSDGSWRIAISYAFLE